MEASCLSAANSASARAIAAAIADATSAETSASRSCASRRCRTASGVATLFGSRRVKVEGEYEVEDDENDRWKKYAAQEAINARQTRATCVDSTATNAESMENTEYM